jgi:hypothetical protein
VYGEFVECVVKYAEEVRRLKYEYEVCSESSQNLSINNIFLHLELIEYNPLQNGPYAQQCTSPTTFSTFGSTVRRMFVVSLSSHLG